MEVIKVRFILLSNFIVENLKALSILCANYEVMKK
jgi:hypothetical protein